MDTIDDVGDWYGGGSRLPRRLRGVYRGIIIVSPHGDYLADGTKTLIVKSRRFQDAVGKPLLLIQDKMGLGIIRLGSPREIDLAEFRDKTDLHRITEDERRLWWPGKRHLYEYDVVERDIFRRPIPLEYGTGPQVFVTMDRLRFPTSRAGGYDRTSPVGLFRLVAKINPLRGSAPPKRIGNSPDGIFSFTAHAGEDPRGYAGMDAGMDVGMDPGMDVGMDPGMDAGMDPGMDAGRDAGMDPGRDAGRDPGRDAGRDTGMDPGMDPGRDAGMDPGRNAGRDPGMDPGRDAGRDPGMDTGMDADGEHGIRGKRGDHHLGEFPIRFGGAEPRSGFTFAQRRNSPTGLVVGTSGYVYEWWSDFYGGLRKSEDRFKVYTEEFNGLEINGSFYGAYKRKVWLKLKDMAPRGFAYTAKVNRSVTHFMSFEKGFRKFWREASALVPKLKCLLFQFPERFHYSEDNLARLAVLETEVRCAFEFRDRSWFRPEVYELFRSKRQWSMVITYVRDDTVTGEEWTLLEEGFNPRLADWVSTSDFVYLRLHGSKGKYVGSHRRVIPRVVEFVNGLSDLRFGFIFLNNSDSMEDSVPDAVADARQLRDLFGIGP